MRKLLAVLAVLVSVGCDDPTVHSLITSNFVCVYMPYWMGECDGTELTARAQNVLDYGFVNAEIRCEGEFAHHSTTMKPFTYDARKLQDGSCVTNFRIDTLPNPGQHAYSFAPTKFWSRADAEASTCAQVIEGQTSDDVFRASVEEGELTLSSEQPSTSDTELDIESVCTGFNLSAFGVEE